MLDLVKNIVHSILILSEMLDDTGMTELGMPGMHPVFWGKEGPKSFLRFVSAWLLSVMHPLISEPQVKPVIEKIHLQ